MRSETGWTALGFGRCAKAHRGLNATTGPPQRRGTRPPMSQFIESFLQAMTAGLLIGAVYGLMCVGLGLIFGVMRVINFAHGDFMMLGMYAAFYLFTALGIQTTFGNAVGPFVAILLAGPVLAVFGYAIHLALISRVSGTGSPALEVDG